jgi:hypothetical protein
MSITHITVYTTRRCTTYNVYYGNRRRTFNHRDNLPMTVLDVLLNVQPEVSYVPVYGSANDRNKIERYIVK